MSKTRTPRQFNTVAQAVENARSAQEQDVYNSFTHRYTVGNSSVLIHPDEPEKPLSPEFGSVHGLLLWMKANGWEAGQEYCPPWSCRRMGKGPNL